MAKITVSEPIMGQSGMFYCAGFVNDTYVHFLTDTKPTRKELKRKLLNKYNRENNNMGLER